MPAITSTVQGETLLIVLDRPAKRNALLQSDLQELRALVLNAGARADLRCIIISGADQHFSAGADIEELQGLKTPSEARHHASLAQGTCDALEQCPLPIIAAIEGFCVGGGLEIAMSCDFRVADPSAVFGQVELGIGSIAAWGGIRRLPRLVGVPQAKKLIYTRKHISAQEALRIGIVQELSEAGSVLSLAMEMATQIATAPRDALAWSKRALDQSIDVPLYAGLQTDREMFAALASGPDFQNGVAVFFNKKSTST